MFVPQGCAVAMVTVASRHAPRHEPHLRRIHPDITFYEPEEAIEGPAALDRKVQQMLGGAPGWVFRPAGEVSTNHNLGRLT